MKSFTAGLALIAIAGTLSAAQLQDNCPTLRIGMTYAQIKQGCPDIGTRAVMKLDENHPVYECPSQHILVIGDARDGKTAGLLLWDGPIGRPGK